MWPFDQLKELEQHKLENSVLKEEVVALQRQLNTLNNELELLKLDLIDTNIEYSRLNEWVSKNAVKVAKKKGKKKGK